MTSTEGTGADLTFPAALAAALELPFDHAKGEGVDFEAFPAFLTAEDTTDWFRAWTGNPEVDGDAFRVFGQDGTGGYAAFWLVRPGRPPAEQPVVYLGSEGEAGVVARDLADLLWVFAAGLGPREAPCASAADWIPRPDEQFTAVARRFAPDRERPWAAVVEQAAQESPEFEDTVFELCG